MSLDPVIYQELMKSVESNWLNLYQVHEDYQTEELCMIAINQSGYAIKFVKNQTEEICLAAVSKAGESLEFVKQQTTKICLAAVNQQGHSLECVINQTNEICMAAVENDCTALAYVKKQTPEICLAAVKNNGYSLQYVKNQTPEICLAAVLNNGYALYFVNDMHALAKVISFEQITFAKENKTGDFDDDANLRFKELEKLKYRTEMIDGVFESIHQNGTSQRMSRSSI